MSRETCGTCVYFRLNDPYSSEGRCYRFPPQVVANHGPAYSHRPTVSKLETCGEHKAEPPTAKEPSHDD